MTKTQNPKPPQSSQQRAQIASLSAANPYNEQLTAMPAVGDKLSANVIQSCIGEGGSADVFKVWNEELEVVRAIKILKRGYKADSRERFFTEAKILADIRHPNIVEIHNISYTDEQVPYLELEYIDGVSIKDLISKNGRMPFAVALSVAYFICQALRYAHTKDYTLYGKVYKGLIHRDIKPENVLISKDGTVKLMDFGIARPSEVSLHTVGGAKIMGTLVYLSPEQLEGKSLDHRSDIFSLGAVLYEMITAHRAFPQKTLVELVQKKTAGHYRSLASYGILFPVRLVRVVEKAMRLHPDERYRDAAEMGYDIYGVLKQISDLPPQDVVASYMRDPSSIPDWSLVDAQHKEAQADDADASAKKSALPWPALIGAAAVGVALSGLVALLFLR